jgi:hypothetical protein
VVGQYLNTPEEIWKPVPDFPGYDISDQGRVRSYWHRKIIRAKNGRIADTEDVLGNFPKKILRPSGKTYQQVILTKEGKHFTFLAHRLVLETFVGPCPPGMEARHGDGIPANCSLENLSWATHSENMLDRTKHGTNWDNRGMNCPTAKLTDVQVLEIRHLAHQGVTQGRIGAIYGIDQSHVSLIVNRRVWSHL